MGIAMLLSLFCRRASVGQQITSVESRRYRDDLFPYQGERRRDRIEVCRYKVHIRKRIEWSMKNVLDALSQIEGIGSVRRVKQCINC